MGEVLRSPFMKFVNYICSYLAFLTLLFFATTLHDEPRVSSKTNKAGDFHHGHDMFAGADGVVNSLIMFYVLGKVSYKLLFPR